MCTESVSEHRAPPESVRFQAEVRDVRRIGGGRGLCGGAGKKVDGAFPGRP